MEFVQNMNCNLSSLRNKIECRKSSIKASTQNKELLLNQINVMGKTISDLECEKAAISSNSFDLKKDTESVDTEISKLSQQCIDMKTKVDNKIMSNRESSIQINVERDNVLRETLRLEMQKENIMKENNILSETLQKERLTNASLRDTLASVTLKSFNLNKTLGDSKGNLEQLKNSEVEASRKLEEYKTRLESAKTRKKRMQSLLELKRRRDIANEAIRAAKLRNDEIAKHQINAEKELTLLTLAKSEMIKEHTDALKQKSFLNNSLTKLNYRKSQLSVSISY